MNCQLCKFWVRVQPDADRGQCRRYPPQAGGVVMQQGIMTQGLQGQQPVIIWGVAETPGDFGCGEWQSSLAMNQ